MRRKIGLAPIASVLLFTATIGSMGAQSAKTFTVTAAGHTFQFPQRWQAYPNDKPAKTAAQSSAAMQSSTAVQSSTAMQSTASMPPPVQGVLMGTSDLQFKPLNDEHLQLLNGCVIVNAKTKALFVSQALGQDKVITRIAPRAIALLSITENIPTITNLSKRCCGAVITYLPAGKAGETNKVSLEAGETIMVERSAERAEKFPEENSLRTFETKNGTIKLRSEHRDMSDTINAIVELAATAQ